MDNIFHVININYIEGIIFKNLDNPTTKIFFQVIYQDFKSIIKKTLQVNC